MDEQVKSEPHDRGRQPSRAQAKAEEIRARVLDLFADQEFSRITIKDIGKACDINPAMIYYYFDSKEDLFRSTIEYAIQQVLDTYHELRSKHDDPVDLINDWFESNVQLSVPLTKLVKIMCDYSFSDHKFPSVDLLIKRLYDEEIAILSENIQVCIERGIFQEADAKNLAKFISVYLDGVFFASMIRSDIDVPTMVSALRELLWGRLARLDGSGPRA